MLQGGEFVRFTTIPQVLAYYRTSRPGEAPGNKLEIVGAFLESNSLADLYDATVEANVVRPEHHVQLPFLSPDGQSQAEDDDGGLGDPDEAARLSLVRAIAKRGQLPTPSGPFEVLAWHMPLRALPSATGSMRQTPHADLVLRHDTGLGVARARVREHHPLIALIEAIHHLAHLNKPVIQEKLWAELGKRDPKLSTPRPANRVLVIAPKQYFATWAGADRGRRSGMSNADVMQKGMAELEARGIRISLLGVEGDWDGGFFTVSPASYAAPTKVPVEFPAV